MSETLEDKIKRIATQNGVEDGAFKMWKSRKAIPHKWQIKIYETLKDTENPLTLEQLKNPF